MIEPPVSFDSDQMLTTESGALRPAALARACGSTLLLLIDP